MTLKSSSGKRIAILDSFRFFAILSVILFHYYSCWLPSKNRLNIYPYGESYNFFSYGYLGVEFFFIISGFVIAYTLYNTNKFLLFWKKRLIRLLPSMFLCSIITYLVCLLIDKINLFPESKKSINIIYSLTLINPDILNQLFRFLKINGSYICYSYWSLWPEIQFYVIASLTYFIRPVNFVRNFSIVGFIIYLINWIFLNYQGSNILHLHINMILVNNYNIYFRDLFNIPAFILWFLLGVFYYRLYIGISNYKIIPFIIMAFLLQLYSCVQWNVRYFFIIMNLAFILFIYCPKYLSFLNNKLMTSIGIASYTLYLIHENIGVLLISKYAGKLGFFSFIFPIILIVVFIFFSILSYYYFEKPVSKKLR